MKPIKNFGIKKFGKFGRTISVLSVFLFAVMLACTDQQAKAKPNLVFKDAPRSGVVAKVGGEEITEEMLIGGEKVDYFEILKKEYDFKMDRLREVMVEKLIGAEAKKANLSTEEFINKKVVGGEIKITDKDVKKFIADKKIPEAQVNDQIKERINNYLKQTKRQDAIEAYVSKLTKNAPVEVYFKKPKMQVQVDVGNAPTYGKADAPVKVIEFSDFQCPFCAKGADVLTEIKKKYGSKVQVAFKQFPLPMHKDAKPAAEASLCVNEQSTDKFWKFHDEAFKVQDKLDGAGLEELAKKAGANVDKFKECMTSKKFAQQVADDMAYGEKVGVRSTPTFFVNGEILMGALPFEQFAEAIDNALEEAKGSK